jgi:chemotaxis signal transduction protein
MRPLPVKTADGLPPGVLGAAIIRGAVLPVVSLPALLKQPAAEPTRFVVVTTPGRDCVLAVDSVESIIPLAPADSRDMPNLLRSIDAAQELATADRDLVVTLNMGLVFSRIPAVDPGLQ